MGRQNGITVERMMHLDCMEKCEVIAGFRGMKNMISKINVMADPDIIHWVDEGEFLLTTAYSFKKDNIEEHKKFIRECADKKLAGVGIKIYPYLEALPKEVLDLADELALPIINLYYATPFSDIMTPVFKEIFNKQALLLEKLEKIYEKLMDVMLKGGDIQEVATTIGENLKNPVLIKLEVPNRFIMHSDTINDATKECLIENAKKFYSPNWNKHKAKELDESTELIQGQYLKRMVMPIVVRDSVFGHIFAWGTSTPLGGFDLSVLEATATTTALDMLRKLSVREVENRYKAEFLEDLISLDKMRRDKAIERAHLFGLHKENKYISVTIRLHHEEQLEESNLIYDVIGKDVSKLEGSMERLLKDLKLKGMVASRTESIIVLLSFKKGKNTDRIMEDFNTKIEKMLHKKTKNIALNIGIGRAYEGIDHVTNSYRDSLKAIRVSEVVSESAVVNFEKIGVFKILSQDHLEEELEKFYDTTIKPLVSYDREKSTELVKTLEAYFQYKGNLKKISRALFTHYNTILYRIQRINEVAGVELEDAEDRLNLEIALKIKQLLNK